MVITDPSKRPSERFIDTITGYFVAEGYEFKKSEKSFIRTTERGFNRVWPQFYTTAGLVSVDLSWTMSFVRLEKIFAFLTGHPKKYKSEISILRSLGIHTRWIPDVISSWPLYDNVTLKCDDFVLNRASTGIISTYETYVIRFCQQFETYELLEKALNVIPIKPPPFSMGIMGDSRHVAFGLLLASYFQRPDLHILVKEYKNLADPMTLEIKRQMEDMIDKTVKFIGENDIKTLLDK